MANQFNLGPEFNELKKMMKKDLAAQLGISGAMVSKLAKRGMPTDTLERAQRWRKRHLEPGRVKGVRFDPNLVESPTPPPARATVAPPVPDHSALVKSAEVAARGLEVALRVSDAALAADALDHLRELLRALPSTARPRMPLSAWVALVDHVMNDEALVRFHEDQSALADPDDFASTFSQDGMGASALAWLDIACDWGGWASGEMPEDPLDCEEL